ncbi:hypothetical protein P4H94_26865 [Paenibacillus macerans]|uniref:hypothetical protein n=1 Tax=Paenibacillus macerans TaxID=44252 RepID=UPI001F113837|nr:hypothetical protein [Paenibacillus macerans]MDU5947451.1 hypothetical protein [Paenibacillus macerans]MEC0140469.1 hypothetical protein [Paenibacillus macerans]UMV45328.1 hypothetical protein LMZ02_17515 [Paenibacillus macerans]
MILYLTSNDHVNLLDMIEQEQNLPVKKLTGQFSLLSFVVKDMRHFSHVRFVAIDRKAVLESDEEMVQALLSFQTMYEIRVIVIAIGLSKTNSFLQQLIHAGITNIASAAEIDPLQEEIRECFSEQGMQRFISPAPPILEVNEPNPFTFEERQYRFECTNIRIAIAGSDRRVGVTTTAMNLMCWINHHGGSACYVEANVSKHLAHIVQLFQAEQEWNAYVIEGNDLYFTNELTREYNFIVIDCGVLSERILPETFVNSDIRILCGSAMPYELPVFYRAMQRCKEIEIHPLALCVPKNIRPYVESMNNNLMFGENSHDLFDDKINASVYLKLLSKYTSN